MSAIQLRTPSIQTPVQIHDSPKKPLSLTVHQVAIPILKALTALLINGVVFGAIGVVFAALIVQTLPLLYISLAAMGACAIFAVCFAEKMRRMETDLKQLKNPEWVSHYSEKLRNAPLEDLMKAIPDKNIWPRLKWSGEEWKEKILPYARAHQMDRKSLESEFPNIFPLFVSPLRDYFRETELPLLQNEGYKAFVAKEGRFSNTVTQEELRAALLKETEGLSCKEAIERVGETPFVDYHLKVEDFHERFDSETKELTLQQIYDIYSPGLLGNGLLTPERLSSLFDQAIDLHPDWTYKDVENQFCGLKHHCAWFQSPRLQLLFLPTLASPDFRFSQSSELSLYKIAKLPADFVNLFQELRAEITRIKAKSKGHEEAEALYRNEPYEILECFEEKDGYFGTDVWRSVDNPKKDLLEQEYKSWQRADQLYQERMLQDLDEKARQKFAELIKARAG